MILSLLLLVIAVQGGIGIFLIVQASYWKQRALQSELRDRRALYGIRSHDLGDHLLGRCSCRKYEQERKESINEL